jgi:hypothetical protein
MPTTVAMVMARFNMFLELRTKRQRYASKRGKSEWPTTVDDGSGQGCIAETYILMNTSQL